MRTVNRQAVRLVTQWLDDIGATHATIDGPDIIVRQLSKSSLRRHITEAWPVAARIHENTAYIYTANGRDTRLALAIHNPVRETITYQPVGNPA